MRNNSLFSKKFTAYVEGTNFYKNKFYIIFTCIQINLLNDFQKFEIMYW